MKKRLLLSLALVLGSLSSFAYNVGDYIYTPTAKLKIVADQNLVTNGSFESQTTGWTGKDGSAAVDLTNWSLESAAGPNGETTLQSTNGGDGVDNYAYQSVALSAGNVYVLSFQVKGSATTSTTTTVGSANYIDAFANADGSVDKTSARQIFTASDNVITAEWTTISDTIVCNNDEYLVFGVGRLDAGTQVTGFAVQLVQQVYDTRIAERRIAYDKKILALTEFPEAKTDLQEIVDQIAEGLEKNDMSALTIDIDDVDAMTGLMDGLTTMEKAYLDANSYDLCAGGVISNSAVWYNKVQKGSGTVGDWYLSGGRWMHTKGNDQPLYDYIQASYSLGANYAEIQKTLPAGKYFFQIEAKGSTYTSGTTIDYVTPVTNQLYICNDSTAADTLSAREYQTYFIIADVPAGETETAKNLIAGFRHQATAKGGAFYYQNPVLRLISPTAEADITKFNQDNLKATQLNAAKTMIDSANVVVVKDEYYWGKTTLQSAIATQTSIYNTLEATESTALLPVLDADGNPVIDENGNEETKTVADSLKQVMTNMRSAISAFYGVNKPISELEDAITSAQSSLDDEANAGATASLRTALANELEKANGILKGFKARTDSVEGDRAQADAEIAALSAAVESFTASTASYTNPSEITVQNPYGQTSSGWEATNDGTSGAGWRKANANAAFENGYNWCCWKGYSYYPKNKATQMVTLTHAGAYEIHMQARSWNENSGRDGNQQSDTKVVFFAKLDEAADSIASITLHTNRLYVDTLGYGAYTPDYFVITYNKPDETPTAIQIGIDGLQNSRCNSYGFGGVHVKYMGDYNNYVSDAAATLTSELATAKAALEQNASIMADSVEYKALSNAVLAATSALDGTTLAYPISATIKAPYLQTYVGWVEPSEENEAKAFRAQTATDTDKKAALESKALLNLKRAKATFDAEAEAVAAGIKGVADNQAAAKVAIKGVYNIAGQKVAENADNLPAGLYIVNGKKIVIK